MSLGFIIILGIVLVVFYLFMRKIFSEDKIIKEDTKEKGNVLPIDIDKKLKKQDGKKDKEDKDSIDDTEDIKDAKQEEVDNKKSKTMSEDYEKNSDM